MTDNLEALEHHDTLAEELRDEVCQPDHAE